MGVIFVLRFYQFHEILKFFDSVNNWEEFSIVDNLNPEYDKYDLMLTFSLWKNWNDIIEAGMKIY